MEIKKCKIAICTMYYVLRKWYLCPRQEQCDVGCVICSLLSQTRSKLLILWSDVSDSFNLCNALLYVISVDKIDCSYTLDINDYSNMTVIHILQGSIYPALQTAHHN